MINLGFQQNYNCDTVRVLFKTLIKFATRMLQNIQNCLSLLIWCSGKKAQLAVT